MAAVFRLTLSAPASTAAAASCRDPPAAQALHRRQDVLVFPARDTFVGLGNGDLKRHFQNFLNSALRRAGSSASAAVKKFSMKM